MLYTSTSNVNVKICSHKCNTQHPVQYKDVLLAILCGTKNLVQKSLVDITLGRLDIGCQILYPYRLLFATSSAFANYTDAYFAPSICLLSPKRLNRKKRSRPHHRIGRSLPFYARFYCAFN